MELRPFSRKQGRFTINSLPPYEVLEHMADAGVVARGSSLADLLVHAAQGMFSLMVDLDGVQAREERRIEVEARDLEGLLVNWLSELLYYVDSEEMLFRDFSIDEIGEWRATGRASGEKLDRDRHDLLLGVKGITRHMLDVRETEAGYEATILLDV